MTSIKTNENSRTRERGREGSIAVQNNATDSHSNRSRLDSGCIETVDHGRTDLDRCYEYAREGVRVSE